MHFYSIWLWMQLYTATWIGISLHQLESSDVLTSSKSWQVVPFPVDPGGQGPQRKYGSSSSGPHCTPVHKQHLSSEQWKCKEVNTLTVFKKQEARENIWADRQTMIGVRDNHQKISFINCIHHQTLRWLSQGQWDVLHTHGNGKRCIESVGWKTCL